jgi:hypothetical protein
MNILAKSSLSLTAAVAMLAMSHAAMAQSVAVQPAEASQAGAPVSPGDATSANGPAQPYTSSDTLGDASKLKAGDADVVSNGPVADTPDHRAQYGKPMSHAGRRTQPSGD